MQRLRTHNDTTRRRAVAAVLVVASTPVLIGFAVLTIDVGVMYSTRGDLQNAADAAALAGAAALGTDTMTQLRFGAENSNLLVDVRSDVAGGIKIVSVLNQSFGVARTMIEERDVRIGWIDLTSGETPLQPGVAPSAWNAIEVVVRRGANSVNGPVALMFAPLFGKKFTDVTASAVAAFDDRFSGFETGSPGTVMLPLSMDVDDYDDAVTAATDDYGFDANGDVTPGADGSREVIAYPGNQAPGNYGLLNIGVPNMSLPELGDQIENGVQPEEFEMETGSSELSFYDEFGDPESYTISGNPGQKAALEDSLLMHVGELVAFFVHDGISGGGANSEYNIVGMRFGIVMQASMKTGKANKGLWIQPVTYDGVGVRTNVNAASSGGVAGRLVLAR